MKVDLLALSMHELHQLSTACASAYERKLRGARQNKDGTGVVVEQLLVTVPDAAIVKGGSAEP